jgi:hypothetical protein
MSVCVYCKKRKGKRNCPALKGMICSLCCGEKRMKFIPCPENCPVLKEHIDYTKERKGEKFAIELSREFGELEEESSKILSAIEWSLYSYLIDSPSSLDIEILSGLEYVRRKFSPLTFLGEVKNIFGEILLKFLERGVKEGYIDGDKIPGTLDKVIKFVKNYKGENIRSNEFVKGFIGYMEKYQPERVKKIKESKSTRIIEV